MPRGNKHACEDKTTSYEKGDIILEKDEKNKKAEILLRSLIIIWVLHSPPSSPEIPLMLFSLATCAKKVCFIYYE